MLADRIPEIQAALSEGGFDGWLFAVFQQNDPVSLDLLGLSGEGKLVTRRCYYLIPKTGAPRKLVHGLEPAMLDHLPGDKTLYTRWQEHREGLAKLVSGIQKLACQYSPLNALPTVSRLDAGTAELLRGAGCELQTSARPRAPLRGRLERRATRRPPACQRASASPRQGGLRAASRSTCATAARSTSTPCSVSCSRASSRPGCGPSRRPSSASTSTAPTRTTSRTRRSSSPILRGDFLLIDLWAKEKAPDSVYADITWCGVCAASPTDRQQEVWNVDAAARDAGCELVRSRYPHTPVRGFEVDDATRGGDRERRLRRPLHPPHRPLDRHPGPRPGRQHGQPRDPRRTPAAADDRLLDRARHLPHRATSACAPRSTSRSLASAPGNHRRRAAARTAAPAVVAGSRTAPVPPRLS